MSEADLKERIRLERFSYRNAHLGPNFEPLAEAGRYTKKNQCPHLFETPQQVYTQIQRMLQQEIENYDGDLAVFYMYYNFACIKHSRRTPAVKGGGPHLAGGGDRWFVG